MFDLNIFIVVLLFIALDFLSGTVAALKAGVFTSTEMRKGLFNKGGEIIVIVLAGLVDFSGVSESIGVSVSLVPVFSIYVILMEIGSILENVDKINPNVITKNLSKYFERIGGSENENGN